MHCISGADGKNFSWSVTPIAYSKILVTGALKFIKIEQMF